MFKVSSTLTTDNWQQDSFAMEAEEEATGADHTTPFSCHDFIQWLDKKAAKFPRTVKKIVTKHCLDVLNVSLLTIATENFSLLYQIVVSFSLPILILQKTCYKTGPQYKILADFRHFKFKKAVMAEGLSSAATMLGDKYHKRLKSILRQGPHLTIVLDTKTFACNDVSFKRLPRLDVARPKRFQNNLPFFELVNLPNRIDDPQSLLQLKQAMKAQRHDNATNVKLQIFYCISIVPMQSLPWYAEFPSQESDAVLKLMAFSKVDGSIGYAHYYSKSNLKVDRQHQSVLAKLEQNREQLETDLKNIDPSSPNRRAAVAVSASGLLQAHQLRCCSREEWLNLTNALSCCVGALWLTCDSDKSVRHVLYKDCETECDIELKPECEKHETQYRDFNERQWQILFGHIEKRAKSYKIKMRDILSPVLNRLEPFSKTGTGSNWRKCLQSLLAITNCFKVFVFGSDDFFLHALKVPFAGVVGIKNKKHGVHINSMPDNSITSMSCFGINLINLQDYLKVDCEMFKLHNDDEALWTVARDWLQNCSHLFDNNLGSLSYPEIAPNMSTIKSKNNKAKNSYKLYNYIKMRSARNTIAILRLYQELCHFFAATLNVDLVCQKNASLSRLGYESIWTNYGQMAGPLCHAMEKVSPMVESLIRPHCLGGFSFSCQDFVEEGKPMGQNMEIAASVREYDLVSAYGHAGSSISCASGFGVTFGKGMLASNRYKGFEYRAVMYTIFCEKSPIASVYSNFSPLGLITINKYPIDLVIVLENGDIKMYNMDGHYCHGHYSNPNCRSLPRYANGKSRLECESKTRSRDDFINQWITRTNLPNISYTVITDCCDENYMDGALTRAFKSIPDLCSLVSGMNSLPGLDFAGFDANATCFLAVADVSFENVPTNFILSGIGPIFDYDKELKMQKTTWSKKNMMLTTEYYTYLRDVIGKIATLKVDNVQWVIYYKNDQGGALNKVFSNLLKLRKDFANAPTKAGLIKAVVNYSCGYFGLNRQKSISKTRARIITKLPKSFNLYTHSIDPIDGFGFNDLLLIRSSVARQSAPSCPTPLPLFVSIIEHGKVRLNYVFHLLQKFLRPTAFRILYSNVDNVIVTLADNDWKNCLKSNHSLYEFECYWQYICPKIFDVSNVAQCKSNALKPNPGQLKLEWSMPPGANWKFVSPFCMYYAIVSDNPDVSPLHKTNAFNNLVSGEAYDIAMAILQRQSVSVPQCRRLDKLAGSTTHIVNYTFNGSF